MKLNELIATEEFIEEYPEAEIWKAVKDYPKYAVSNKGRIKNLVTGKLRKLQTHLNGYLAVDLANENGIRVFGVHRLVAEAFLDKKDFKYVDEEDAYTSTFGFENYNFLHVNHKDEDKTNNCVENLEWCTRRYNNNYGTGNQRRSEAMKAYRAARCLEKTENFVENCTLNYKNESVTVDEDNETLEINI